MLSADTNRDLQSKPSLTNVYPPDFTVRGPEDPGPTEGSSSSDSRRTVDYCWTVLPSEGPSFIPFHSEGIHQVEQFVYSFRSLWCTLKAKKHKCKADRKIGKWRRLVVRVNKHYAQCFHSGRFPSFVL